MRSDAELNTFDIIAGECEEVCCNSGGCTCCAAAGVDRTAPGGQTHSQRHFIQRKLKNRNKFLDAPRSSNLFANWKTPDKRSKGFKSRAVKTVNKLYRKFLSYGDPQAFYDCKLHTAKSQSEFEQAKSRATTKLYERKKSNKTALEISCPVEFESED
ncbi:hypothetical protein THAOC_27405, partial [Thalassiosira oceanica]